MKAKAETCDKSVADYLGGEGSAYISAGPLSNVGETYSTHPPVHIRVHPNTKPNEPTKCWRWFCTKWHGHVCLVIAHMLRMAKNNNNYELFISSLALYTQLFKRGTLEEKLNSKMRESAFRAWISGATFDGDGIGHNKCGLTEMFQAIDDCLEFFNRGIASSGGTIYH